MRGILTAVLLCFTVIYCTKRVKPYKETLSPSKYNNPNFIRDRFKDVINKPYWNDSWQTRFDRPFHPAWMDYCDPYHCNDYHKPACGLNRRKMHFKWFQSGCHISLNNMCATYRGNIKYDMIDPKYCVHYTIFLRMGCPTSCDAEETRPVCGISNVDNHVVLFRSRCALDAANCRQGFLQEYEKVDTSFCAYFHKVSLL